MPPGGGHDAPNLAEVSDSSSSEDSASYDEGCESGSDRDCEIPTAFPPDDDGQEMFPQPDAPEGGSEPIGPIDYDVMAGAVRPSWLKERLTHGDAASRARRRLDQSRQQSRRTRRAVECTEYSAVHDSFTPWPRRSTDPPSPPPPVITRELVHQVVSQDVGCHPDKPYPPALQSFVADLEAWRQRLTEHFNFDSSCFAGNTRAAASRIRQRISFLPRDLCAKVMDIVTNGYTIPFSTQPPRFHRRHNSPDLSDHMEAAWAALKKDMGHGAVLPCNLARDGKPHVMSPVRTAPKGWRSSRRRFVINMRFLNKLIPEEESACSLDTLSRIRNLITFPGDILRVAWLITMGHASGYHNFWIARDQWHLMGFALHRSELPAEAIEFLRQHFPECEDHQSGNFYFLMRALPFGLAPSCAVFSLVVTALAAAWRRHKVCCIPTRLTSYIDDFLSISKTARQALISAIELVYEATVAGLTIQVEKCRLGPATRAKYLGIIIDTRHQMFRLPTSRVERINIQLAEIRRASSTRSPIPARWIAQLVGLLWAISPCCSAPSRSWPAASSLP